MKKVSGPQVVTATEAVESPLPAEIQEVLGEQFRRIVGYSDLAKLVTAIEQRHLTLESLNNPELSTDAESAAVLANV